jgi:hypothetical protein
MPEITIPAGYGLYLLAAAAIVAIWGTTPAGQKAAKDTGRAISKALERSETDAPPITDCPPQEKDCSQSPCPAPPPPRIDRVPPSATHHPCPGDHAHFFKYNQNPVTCQCFLQKIEPPTCLPQGGFP